MSIWSTIKGWTSEKADQHIEKTLDPGEPIRPDTDYFRIWVQDMFLSNRTEWFQTYYPAVNASVRLKFGTKREPITLSYVTGTPETDANEGVKLNFPVTGLLPYRGGTVEIQAGLIGLQGGNALKATISVLKDFSGLVVAPLGTALDIADKVASGIDTLLLESKGSVRLAFHQGFTATGGGADNVFRQGIICVVLAPAGTIDTGRLAMIGGRLHYSDSPGAAPTLFASHDYMTFRIERREFRDDWRLYTIEQPMFEALKAITNGNAEEATALKRATVIAAYTSEDLTAADKRRVIAAIKDEFAYAESIGLGAVAEEAASLESVLQTRGPAHAEAANQGPIGFAEALAGV